MATLIPIATGNLTASSTWGLCDSTSELDNETNSTNTTTSFVYSSTFTPAASTIDGIAIKIISKTSGGTFSIDFFNNTGSSSVTTVTVDVADLDIGWNFLKFGSSQAVNGSTVYKIGIKSSTINTVTCYRDATTGNWSRQLRTTTTQAPAAGDKLIIIGELTGSGTGNTLTVTMDQTATTSYGSTSFNQSISVGKRGVLTFGTTASTNYILKFKGIMRVSGGGILNTGVIAGAMPSSSTAKIQFDVTSNVDTVLVIGNNGTWNGRGNPLSFVKTTLSADAAAAATSLTTTDSTSWKSGDVLAIASTSRTSTESESRTLSINASGTTLTVAALTNAHSGTSPTKAEIGNLTRNIQILGTSSTLQGYVFFDTTSVIDIQYIEFSNLGSAVIGKRGVEIQTTTGSCNIQYCSIHDCLVSSSFGINISGTTVNNITISNNIIYNVANNLINIANATSGTSLTFDNNLCILSVSSSIFNFLDIGGSVTNNVAVGASIGFSFVESSATLGTFTGNTVHSCNQGINLNSTGSQGTLSNITCYRANTYNIIITSCSDITISNSTLFGATNSNLLLATGAVGQLSITNCTFDGGATSGDALAATSYGLRIESNPVSIILTSCTFSVTKAHNLGDICFTSIGFGTTIFLYNCILNNATEVYQQTNMTASSVIRSQKHDQTVGNHKYWAKYGIGAIDTVIYDVTPSLRLTPNNASNKFESRSSFKVAVSSGQTATVSVKVRKSVVGDGTAYNGNFPRLIVKANIAAGITTDTVLATATSASAGAWETLSGTTASVTDDCILEFIVDCDGTTGWVNVDTWSSTTINDSKGNKYWLDGYSFPVSDNIAAGGGVTSFAY